MVARESVGSLIARKHMIRSRISRLRQIKFADSSWYGIPCCVNAFSSEGRELLLGTSTAISLNFAGAQSLFRWTDQPSCFAARIVAAISKASAARMASILSFLWWADCPIKPTPGPYGAGSLKGTRLLYSGWEPASYWIKLLNTELTHSIIGVTLRKFVDNSVASVVNLLRASRKRPISARRNRYIDCFGSPTKKSLPGSTERLCHESDESPVGGEAIRTANSIWIGSVSWNSSRRRRWYFECKTDRTSAPCSGSRRVFRANTSRSWNSRQPFTRRSIAERRVKSVR